MRAMTTSMHELFAPAPQTPDAATITGKPVSPGVYTGIARIVGHPGEFNRLSANATRLADFGVAAKMAFGEDRLNESVADLGESDREALIESIGKYILNEVRRQLLLGATSELWVEYLTRIEALRVSISLEAYAQRDPLVQYKAKASELFTQLVEDIRGLVVSRAFTAQRRPVEITPVESAEVQAEAEDTSTDQGGRKS